MRTQRRNYQAGRNTRSVSSHGSQHSQRSEGVGSERSEGVGSQTSEHSEGSNRSDSRRSQYER